MPVLDLSQALDVAQAAVRAASAAALPFFRAGVAVETKADRSPVTEADKSAEAAIIATIRATYPSHSMLTEESGALSGEAEYRWIVDPLDGTRGFTRGGSFWGPLIALEHRGEIVVGAMAMPVTGETYWAARGLGAWRDGVRLRVSSIDQWEDATLSVGELSRISRLPQGPGVQQLIRTCTSMRAFGDVGSLAMFLNGRAEAWIEGGVRVWDLAPAVVMVEEAGGRFTDFDGQRTPESGSAVASNAALHPHVLSTLHGS